MQTHKRTIVTAAAYLVMIVTLVIMASSSGQSQAQVKAGGQPSGPQVRVINGTSEPVPVSLQGTGKFTGDVNVVNSPTVKVAAGAQVGIDPASDGVTIKNSASEPVPFRDVDQPARNPHQDGTGSVVASNSFTTEAALSSVPQGKELVMEYFSATAIVPAGQSGFFFITTRAGGVALLHHVPAIQKFADTAFAGSDLLVAAQPLRIYADPGTTPSVSFRRSANTGPSTFSADISGHFVNL